MAESESLIARKHTEIGIKLKATTKAFNPKLGVYIATYTANTAGQEYQRIEADSGEEFWSIRVWSASPRRCLKFPGAVITQEKMAKYLIEIKWGAVAGSSSSDLMINEKEQNEIANVLSKTELCRVIGPAVQNGRRFRSGSFRFKKSYSVDSSTKLILVSNFLEMKQRLGIKLAESLILWKRANPKILIADINTRVDDIPSFQELLEQDTSS